MSWSQSDGERIFRTLIIGLPMDAEDFSIDDKAIQKYLGSVQERCRREPWKHRRRRRLHSKFHTSFPDDNKAYANLGRRAMAQIIDWIFVSAIGTCLVSVVAFIGIQYSFMHVDAFSCIFLVVYGFFIYALGTALPVVSAVVPLAILSRMFTPQVAFEFSGNIWAFISFALLYVFPSLVDIFYRAGMESSGGQATLGKMIMRIYVADEFGGRISFRDAMLRNISKILVVVSLVKRLKRSNFERQPEFHDTLTNTCVLTEVGLASRI